MTKTMVITCDLCGKQMAEGEGETGELILRGSRAEIDICDACAEPLAEKLAPVEKHVCPECGKTFEQLQGVRVHRARMHGGHKWASNPKR